MLLLAAPAPSWSKPKLCHYEKKLYKIPTFIYFFNNPFITFFLPLQNLKAGLLSQFDCKISIAIQANLPWESYQTLLVYNRYDEREKQNTNGAFVAIV